MTQLGKYRGVTDAQNNEPKLIFLVIETQANVKKNSQSRQKQSLARASVRLSS
jgi:hypothetical protein